jgi:hypothetical protein
MITLTCDCGHKAEDADPYKVQAKMWHHALKDHSDMLKSMTEEQIEGILRKHAQETGLAK